MHLIYLFLYFSVVFLAYSWKLIDKIDFLGNSSLQAVKSLSVIEP